MPDDPRDVIENAPVYVPPDASGDADGEPQKLKQRDLLVMTALDGADFWHAADRSPYATVRRGKQRESYPLRSRDFRCWLVSEFGDRFPNVIHAGRVLPGIPSNNAMIEGLNALEAIAYKGPQRQPAVRVGSHDGKIYLDLGTADWSAVEIDATGWRVVSDPPVPFLRPSGLAPLPVPERGGSLNDLYQFLNLKDSFDQILVVSWLVATLRPSGPYPILTINGEQGSAKSTTSRLLRRLIDPNGCELRAPPKEDRDLLIAARNSHVLAIDNLSYIEADFSDVLCRISTGSGFSTRALYSDSEELLIQVCRPILLNGIPSLSSRPDLGDRSIGLMLPPIPESRRRPEAEFWSDFERAWPRILSALLDGASLALLRLPGVKLDRLPRMADFALWACAAAPAFGWTEKDFLAAYESNRSEGVADQVEADHVACAIQAMFEAGRKSWRGTATELLVEINTRTADIYQREKGWPKDGTRLSGRLRRIAPALRRVGLDLELDHKEGKRSTRIITITPVPTEHADAAHGGTDAAKTASVGDNLLIHKETHAAYAADAVCSAISLYTSDPAKGADIPDDAWLF